MDDVDLVTNRQETIDAIMLAANSEAVKQIAEGHKGICDRCGNHSPRLMNADFFEKKHLYQVAASVLDGICPPCRDKFKLP